MPQCRLYYNGTTRDWSRGGCFGFMGRSSSVLSNGQECSMFEYNVREQQLARGGNLQGPIPEGFDGSPKRFYEWLASNSPWAKYVDSLTYNGDNVQTVKIKVDCPGHAVIGTASMFRLYAHKPWLIIHWNMMVADGCDPMISFLLAWSFGGDREAMTRTGVRNPKYQQGLSDDEPMCTQTLSNFSVYQMIQGTWEFNYNDHESPRDQHYQYLGRYRQEIIASYQDGVTGPEGLYQYIQRRFFNGVVVDYMSPQNAGRSSGGMGRSRESRAVRASGNGIPVTYKAMVGAAHQLEFEFKKYGKFLHFGNGGAV